MPVFVTVFIAKLVRAASRLSGKGRGSAVTGLVAEKIDPQIAAKLAQRLPQGSIVVTGTNGKTTTTKMLVAILEAEGRKVLTNRSGSNLTRGIASTLIEAAGLSGGMSYDIAVFEVDEASMPRACGLLEPHTVLVLNLFRDQLDRYGELDKTAEVIGRTLAKLKADIWLNADDPLVASLMSYVTHASKLRYFGVETSDTKRLAHDVAADSSHCPMCGEALEYSQNYFGHIGHYRCPAGHFRRPMPEVWLKQGGNKAEIGSKSEACSLKLSLPGLYNAYNALAAAAAATSHNVTIKAATEALEGVEAAFGRVERLEYSSRQVYLLLIKNPTGFNQVIQTFLTGSQAKHMMIAVNDNFADGRDVSWLWDVGFEEINPRASIVSSGIRAYDMALRLKYAGRTEGVVEPELHKAFERAIESTPVGGTLFVLPTYTAMLDLRRWLTKKGEVERW